MTAITLRVDGANQAATVVQRLAITAQGLGRATVLVGTNVAYARYVHDGTRPHTILPRSRKALSWPGARHPVRRVRHPGSKGNPFLTDALQASLQKVRAVIARGLQAVKDGADAATGAQAVHAAGLVVQAEAQRRANVRTGTLRRSLTTILSRGG